MKKETHYFYKYHFKVAAVKPANHPDIQTQAVAEALKSIHSCYHDGKNNTGKGF